MYVFKKYRLREKNRNLAAYNIRAGNEEEAKKYASRWASISDVLRARVWLIFPFYFFREILSSAQLGESFCFPNKILGYYNSCGGWLHLPVLCPHGSGRGDIVGFSHGKSGLCHLVRLRLLDLWNADGCEHLFYDFFPFFFKKWGCFCFIRECLYGI